MAEILEILKRLDNAYNAEIESWLADRRRIAAPFFYTSVDLRHSGLRLVPVDTNLYPAGFNNISPAARARASRFIARFFEDHYPKAKRALIIPENHTRNQGYLENLAVLLSIFEEADVEVRLGSLAAQPGQPIELDAPSGRHLTEYPLKHIGDRLKLEDGYDPDVIIMNNDLTGGMPEMLNALAQPILPPACMGWWQRRKSVHFEMYKTLIDNFCAQFDLDPWLFSAEFYRCGIVDFKERTGLDKLARGVELVLKRARAKRRQYGIKDEPYVYVKAESGTYGMGVMMVRSPEEVLELNKKDRNKMQVIKEGTRNSDVIIQEGVPTVDKVDGKPAEPVVYMIDGIPVGGMYRVNAGRDALNNLNAAGMEFTGMCDEVEEECGRWKSVDDCNFRSLGIIAAIAALAAPREDYTVGSHGAGI